jgi:4-hydroxy-tetrahydrodipicolinate synthase
MMSAMAGERRIAVLEDGVTPAQPTMFCMVVTAMDQQGQIDEEGCRAHLRRMIDGGVGIYLASGGSGQGHALEPHELKRVYEIGVSECKGKIPVYCNPPEARTAKEMIGKCQLAIEAGVEVVQLYQIDSGHGRHPTLTEQERYFRDCLEAIDHPVVLSIHQSSGFLAPVTMTAKLCNDYPQIKGVNLHGPSLPYFVQLQDSVSPSVKLYGGSNTLLSMLPLGGWGAQAAEPNLVPNLSRSIIDHFLAGRVKEMGDTYKQLLRIWGAVALAEAESQDGRKAVLRAMGLPGGYSRPPRAEVSEATLDKVRKNLEALHIWDLEKTASLTPA